MDRKGESIKILIIPVLCRRRIKNLIAMHKLWKRVRESINQIKIKIVQICSAFVKCRNGFLVSGFVGSNGTTLAKRLHIS
ncbi:hypothetical protein T07_10794 [Trichinella nelsoni]|uniref:Uncharacterized protein n=1 Tax=Trichinella nelsoni TaxID=6336 RepID=A0A0V0SLK1_9BILA|nr:hypothetical protein T07_10794 [Trichinella nelsoni]